MVAWSHVHAVPSYLAASASWGLREKGTGDPKSPSPAPDSRDQHSRPSWRQITTEGPGPLTPSLQAWWELGPAEEMLEGMTPGGRPRWRTNLSPEGPGLCYCGEAADSPGPSSRVQCCQCHRVDEGTSRARGQVRSLGHQGPSTDRETPVEGERVKGAAGSGGSC